MYICDYMFLLLLTHDGKDFNGPKGFSLVDWTVEIVEEKFGVQVVHKSGRTYVFHKWDLVGTPKSNYLYFHEVVV